MSQEGGLNIWTLGADILKDLQSTQRSMWSFMCCAKLQWMWCINPSPSISACAPGCVDSDKLCIFTECIWTFSKSREKYIREVQMWKIKHNNMASMHLDLTDTVYYCLHFNDKEMEAQRSRVVCPGSQSKKWCRRVFKSRPSDSGVHAFIGSINK